MTRTARLANQGELISALPYIVGFHPRDAVVLVFLRNRQVRLTARLDLPPPPGPLPREVSAPLRQGIRCEQPDVVMMVVYDDTRAAYRGLVHQLTRLCRKEGVRVGDRLLVADGRWRELNCSNPRCCPPEGRPVRYGDEVPAVAEFVAMGVNPLPDRESIERFFEPRGESVLDVTSPPADAPATGITQWRRDGLSAWARILGVPSARDGGMADLPASGANEVDQILAQRAVDLLADIRARDALLGWLCPDLSAYVATTSRTKRLLAECLGSHRLPVDPAESAELTWRLREFARALPPAAQVGVLTMTGAHSWWLGEGIFARVALERAVDLDPSHELAGLLLDLVYAGVRLRPGA